MVQYRIGKNLEDRRYAKSTLVPRASWQRAGNYISNRVGANEAETSAVLDIAEMADPTGIIGKARKLWSWGKGLFGGTPQSDKDRQAKLTKFFAEIFPQINPNATLIVQKINGLGGAFAQAQLAASQTKSYHYMANLYATYIKYNNGVAVAQGYDGGTYYPADATHSWTWRAGGLDQAMEAYGELTNIWNAFIAKIKTGEADPISWSTYRESNGRFFVDKWDGTKFVEQEVSAADRERRKNILAPDTVVTPPPVVVTIPSSNPVLKLGVKSEDVKNLQITLSALGYNVGVADGDFGTQTQAAVKAFQKKYGLSQDGVVGTNVWNALRTVLGGNSATITPPAEGETAVTIVTSTGETKTLGGGGNEGGQSGESTPFYKKPLFWIAAAGGALLLGGGGFFAFKKLRKPRVQSRVRGRVR